MKAFEIAVKEGHTGAVMDAHCFIGDKWVGASSELNNTVLRDEWGFQEMCIRDRNKAVQMYFLRHGAYRKQILQ